MKVPVSWLSEYVDIDISLDDLTHRLTMAGNEVDSIERTGWIDNVVVGHVQAVRPHPNADRLKVCRVETAAGEVEVVCGAPNAVTGMKAVFAPAGSYLPGPGHTFDKAEIRGVVSNGMLLSEREMGLGEPLVVA